MKKILVPVDGSGQSQKALGEAVTLAKKFGSSILLVSVVEVESEVSYSEFGIAMSGDYAGVRDTLIGLKKDDRQKILDAIVDKLDCTGIEITQEIRVGTPHHVIVDVAQTAESDLIVMGHRGLNPLKRLFIGSVAKHVVDHAPCSVLVVK